LGGGEAVRAATVLIAKNWSSVRERFKMLKDMTN